MCHARQLIMRVDGKVVKLQLFRWGCMFNMESCHCLHSVLCVNKSGAHDQRRVRTRLASPPHGPAR